MSTMSEPTAQIVHEKQSWQRCALHAINNLLQLSPKDPSGFESRLYHGGKSLSLDVSPACTRKELDDIADNLTVRENDLTSTTLKISEVRRSPSFYVRCRSHHGAPVFGNYSYEVVETALERRNIRLERIEADKQEAIDINDCVTDEDSAGLIGFVVNVEVHATGLVMRVAQRLLWPGGRHWYVVTRLQRGEEKDANRPWRLLDSMQNEAQEMTTSQVSRHLQQVSENGGSTFRAVHTTAVFIVASNE
jgi:hypothetical protein